MITKLAKYLSDEKIKFFIKQIGSNKRTHPKNELIDYAIILV